MQTRMWLLLFFLALPGHTTEQSNQRGYEIIGEHERRPFPQQCAEYKDCMSCIAGSCYWYILSPIIGKRICFPNHLAPPTPMLIEKAIINSKNCTLDQFWNEAIPTEPTTPRPLQPEKGGETMIYIIIMAIIGLFNVLLVFFCIWRKWRTRPLTGQGMPQFGGDLPMQGFAF